MVTYFDLAALVNYDPVTGAITWKVAKQSPGRNLGHVDSQGYRTIFWGRKWFLSHRLAWLISTGSLPKDQIDHKNLDRLDNRLANLRECSRAQNAANTVARGKRLKGVGLLPSGRFKAQIRFKRKRIYIGSYDTEEEANAAYGAKAQELYGEFARAA